MITVGDVRRWGPMGLHAVAADLQRQERTLLDTSDALDATAQPSGWAGDGAAAAREDRDALTGRTRRVVAQVQAVATAVRGAGESVLAVHAALRETEELAGRYWFRLGDDGAVRDALPDGGLITDAAFAADRLRVFAEVQSRAATVVRVAAEIDDELTRVLTAAVQGTTDDGPGASLASAAFRGLAEGVDPTLPTPPAGGSPAANNAWWDSLTPAQRTALLARHPDWLGGTDGLPAAVRDRANRARLPGELARAQDDLAVAAAARARLGTGTSTDRSADLAMSGWFEEALARRDALTAIQRVLERDGRTLLVLDPHGEMVKAAVAVGDVDTADHVAVDVPGMTTTVQRSLAGKDDQAALLAGHVQDQLWAAGRGDETVAVVSWLGYEAPQWSELNDDADYSDTAASPVTAVQGSGPLASFLNGIDAARTDDPHLTTNAHSYGTTTTGLALQRGTGVDDAVFFGSPGLGTSRVEDLGLPDGHVYVEEAPGDLVADLGRFGLDPNTLDGVTGLSVEAGRSPDGVESSGSTGHSEYEVDGSMAQHNQAAVIAGLPENAVRGRGVDAGDLWGLGHYLQHLPGTG